MQVALIAAAAFLVYMLVKQGGATAQYTNPYGAQNTLSLTPGGPGVAGSSPVGAYASPYGVPGLPAPGAGGGFNISAISSPAGTIVQGAMSGTLTAATAAVAGVGAGIAIFSALWSAHEQRAKQATNENSAMNVGVQNWDESIKAINAAYNSGQIDPNTAISALQQILQQYWQGVTPNIQAGRNGCGGGSQCPVNLGSLYAGVPGQGAGYCSGSIGAACCVGCANLQVSTVYAIQAIQQGGGQSQVVAVVGSKYGGAARPAYTLTWQRAASA